jgi:hypothetical protein
VRGAGGGDGDRKGREVVSWEGMSPSCQQKFTLLKLYLWLYSIYVKKNSYTSRCSKDKNSYNKQHFKHFFQILQTKALYINKKGEYFSDTGF